MRELIERFTYRFQLWQKERQWIGQPSGGGNPLRIFAFVAVGSIIGDLYYIFAQHRLDAMIVLRMITAPAFLVLYIRSSMWAWYLAVAEGPVFLLLYWFLLAVGGLSRPPRPVSPGFQIGVTVFQLVLLVGIMLWLFMLREPYSRYIAHAQSSKA